jgi:hypothetical protein
MGQGKGALLCVSHAGASALLQLVRYRRVGGCGWLPEFGRRGCKSRLFRASANLGSVRRSHAGACPVYTWLSFSQLTQPSCASASRFRRAGQLWFGRSGWSGWSVSDTNTHNSSPPKGCPGPLGAAHALPCAPSRTVASAKPHPVLSGRATQNWTCTSIRVHVYVLSWRAYRHGGCSVVVEAPTQNLAVRCVSPVADRPAECAEDALRCWRASESSWPC